MLALYRYLDAHGNANLLSHVYALQHGNLDRDQHKHTLSVVLYGNSNGNRNQHALPRLLHSDSDVYLYRDTSILTNLYDDRDTNSE